MAPVLKEDRNAYRRARRETAAGYTDRFMERAKEATPDTDITRRFMERLMAVGRCAVTGKRFSYKTRHPNAYHNPTAPSIDRIDSSRGYYKNNVQIVLSCINRMKNDLGNTEFLVLLHKIAKAMES